MNETALGLGLRPGLALADARARIPDLAAADHDPEADAALLASMAQACDRWTPIVALDPPDGLLLDVTGCAHLVGGEAAMRSGIVARFKAGGFTARAVIAGAPDTARALARFGQSAIVPPGGDEAAVRPLPIAALGLEAGTRSALSLAGLKRIADLADRPPQILAARFGEDLPSRLRRLLGREDRRIVPLRPPPACRVEQAFAEPVMHLDAIDDALRRLAEHISGRLEAAGQGGRSFEASFFRTDGAVRRIRVASSRPLREPGAIIRLLREKLEALSDPLDPGFGYDLVRLDAPAVERLGPLQPNLEGEAAGDDEFCDLVDRLVARFGQARVLRFAFADSHDPLRASRLVPASEAKDAAGAGAEPDETPLRPLHLFDPPQPIEALAEIPDGPPLRFRWRRVLHKVARAEGPERIAAEWWRAPDAPTRDYYRVEDETGGRFWLYRAGLYGRETSEPSWYLHGLFA